MENKRSDLAERMDIVGQVFEVDGMNELLAKFEKGMSNVKFSGVAIQISGLLLKANKPVADRLIAMNRGISMKEVQEMQDGPYASALRDVIVSDVIGFFGSSPRSDGKQ